MSIIVSILSEWNGKALKTAQNQVGFFDKQLKRLAVTLGSAFSVRKIVQFSKASIKAFVEEDKAIRALAQNLSNLGLAYDVAPIERYIRQLQYATGVADSELRPALQQLITTTRSVTQSQELLGLALDISAGTGKSLGQVVQGLSRSFLGTNTSLSRLNLGLSKAELTSKKFDEIVDDLSKRFSGQARRAAGTYAGQLAILSAAANDAQEVLGERLVTSIQLLLDEDTGVTALANSFEDMAFFVGDVSVGLAYMIKQIKTLGGLVETGPSGRDIIQGIPVVGSWILAWEQFGKKDRMMKNKENLVATQHLQSLNKLSQKNLATTSKTTKELNAQNKARAEASKLDKAKGMLDLEKIQIEAALQGDITENEKLRLQLMKAILNENADRATTLADKLSKSQEDLTKFKREAYDFKPENPFDAWLVAIEAMRKGLASIGAPVGAIPGAPNLGTGALSVSPNVPEISVFGGAGFITPELATSNSTGMTQINLTVTANDFLSQEAKQAVVDAVVEASSAGYSTGWFRTTGRAIA